jgi:O-antigen/teichoic acid export membrane protein
MTKILGEHSMRNPSPKNGPELTANRILVKNTIWNLISQTIPLFIALLTIPMLIKGLGTERFGILTLAWTLIGYFTLFDFGISRALTQFLAEKLVSGDSKNVPSIVRTALYLMLLLGVAGGVIMFLVSPWLAHHVLKVQESMQQEMLISLYLLASAVPFIITTAGLCGILAAHQRFDLINFVRIPASILTFCGPILVLFFSTNLLFVIAFLAVEQALVSLAYFRLCLGAMPTLKNGTWFRGPEIIPLLKFGTWMTISNIVGPIMVYMDRFFIGALISLTAVAYYVTPYELVTKLWIVPGSVVAVIFPAFASNFFHNRDKTKLFYSRSIKYIFLLLFPVTLVIICIAHEGLESWLNAEFAKNCTHILQWLAVGVFINSLAQVPLTLIQGIGRPHITTKVHLIELPCYLAALWWLLKNYGIEGAAFAWFARATVDAIILFIIAHRFLSFPRKDVRDTLLILTGALILFVFAAMPMMVVYKGVFLVLSLTGFVLLVKSFMLFEDEKSWLKNTCARLRWWRTC